MKTFFKISLFVLILLIGIAGLSIYWTFYRPLPDYSGTVRTESIASPVEIHWDRYGVPHIYAGNKEDLYYALGYVHAQDRLWQMTLTQLASEGRMAEFLGKELLPVDLFQRTIGIWKTARRIMSQLPDSTLNLLQSYAAGVNSYVDSHRKGLPLEFALTGIEPVEWTPTHTIALSRLMAWELNFAWKNELVFAYLEHHLSPEQLGELIPDIPVLAEHRNRIGKPWNSEGILALLQADKKIGNLLGINGLSIGSNAWAVNSAKTDTDYPLLAGDPHLMLNMPGKWYEVHLNLDGKNVSGATLAGAPAVVLGQNDYLAWSMTNVMADDSDFFVEAVNPDNPNQYVLDTLAGDPLHEQFTLQRELIKVRGAPDTVMVRKLTKHGPVISEIFPNRELVGDRVITMRWTGHEVSNEFSTFQKLHWARSLEEFRNALRNFKVPAQNFIYGDRKDNIALFTAGHIPIRTQNPLLFRAGWNPGEDWRGFIPFDDLPNVINPDRGWVANANNPVQPENYPYYISNYWEPDSRYDRIQQFLTTSDRVSTELFQAMQNDAYSDYARRVTSLVLPVLEKSGSFETAISYLENWDFHYELNETAASIMETFILKLSENTLKDELGEAAYNNFIQYSGVPARVLLRFLREDSRFFDNVNSEQTESRNQMILRSMRDAISHLVNEYGEEPFEWRWEQLHTITLKPLLLGRAAEQPDAESALKLIVNNVMNKGPYAARGHQMSLNNGEYRWTDPYSMVVGPSIRRIVDFSDLGKTLSIIPTGQSGNELSEYYGDQTESWLNGQYKYLYQDSSLFREAHYRTTTLVPEK